MRKEFHILYYSTNGGDIMKVLVTGGSGFIGNYVVQDLKELNYKIVIVDKISPKSNEFESSNLSSYKMDIKDSSLGKIFSKEKPDIVIHLASQISVQESLKNPLSDCSDNIFGTINILQNCVKNGVRKVIFTSSAAVYGIPKSLPVNEMHSTEPISFYGLSKLTAESYIRLFNEVFNLNYTILRLSNVYGMGLYSSQNAGVISQIIGDINNGRQPTIYGDGNQTRDFIHVKDVSRAIILALINGENEILNISSNNETSINDLIKIINTQKQYTTYPNMLLKKDGDIERSCLFNERAYKELNWKPTISLSNGISQLLK